MSYLDDALDMISFDPLKIEDKARAELAALRAENEQFKAAIWSDDSTADERGERTPEDAARFVSGLRGDNERLMKAIKAVESLINESRGVCGLHLNGQDAPWHTLRMGGAFETWLIDFDAALKKIEEEMR